MRSLRIVGSVVILLLLAAIALALLASRPALPPISAVIPPDPGVVQRGAALAALGDCIVCHTASQGRPLAGGRPLATPFGTVYATNITPDPDTGIGHWSEAAFSRAMRDGIDREGHHLYPAFPYDHFRKAADADLAAIYAYLMTRDPVQAEAPPNELVFPLDFRPLLVIWKWLFLDEAGFRGDPAQSAEWNRGAYLVEGLGHCGACHTPRNVLGAVKNDQPFAGGEAEGWHAPALGAATPAPVRWNVDALTTYLRTGDAPGHDAAAGPMLPVVRNLALVPDADVRAIATYIASLSGNAGTGEPIALPAPTDDKPVTAAASDPSAEAGRAVYASACAGCHEAPRESFFKGALDLRLLPPPPPIISSSSFSASCPPAVQGPSRPPFSAAPPHAQRTARDRFGPTGPAQPPARKDNIEQTNGRPEQRR